MFDGSSSYTTTSVLISPTLFNFLLSPQAARLCCAYSSCFTHFFDSVISILLHHCAVCHPVYGASRPCGKIYQVVVKRLKEIQWMKARMHLRLSIHISGHTYCALEMKAVKAADCWKLYGVQHIIRFERAERQGELITLKWRRLDKAGLSLSTRCTNVRLK